MKHEFSTSIERVFEAMNDQANMGKWLGAKIELIKPSTSGGLGAVRRLHLGVATIDEEIVECVAPTHIVYKIVRGLFPLSYHRGEINLTSITPTQCNVVWQIELDSKVPLLASLVRLGLKAAIQTGLKRLDKQLSR